MKADIIEIDGKKLLRLPNEAAMPLGAMELIASGEDFILTRSRPGNAGEIFDILAGMPEDFYSEGRHDPPPDPVPSWDED